MQKEDYRALGLLNSVEPYVLWSNYYYLDHSKSKYSNIIGNLRVSILCRSLVHVSIDPQSPQASQQAMQTQNYAPVTMATHGRLIR